jgi:hydroxymethylpyrimidine pyrophosphatase-like HAD family hydrolase
VVEETGHRGVAVCANGALVYDLHAERVVERFLLEPAVALVVVEVLRTVLPAAVFAVERHESYAHEQRYRMRWSSAEVEVVATVEELLVEPVAKLLVRDETSTGDEMLVTARDVLGDLASVTHSNADDCLLEVAAPGVTKASTLARVAAEHGVDSDGVLAFGDQPNDLPMLLWAGIGYAVADAHPDVLAAVPLRTAAADDDGVAAVLERLLRERDPAAYR